jgi:CDGSH-type Zn-finger protein
MTEAREVIVTADGPVLISGPVEVVLPDGSRVRSDRPVTALCVCRRSRRAPFCDTSHRRKVRTTEGTDHDEETRAQPHRTAAR